jgi:hypothetical protein
MINHQKFSVMPNYKIYPSLLDKFQRFLDADISAEEPWNTVGESNADKHPDKGIGEFILTPDEIRDKQESELLDMINRVPHEPIEAASKGTAFNELVDCIVHNQHPKVTTTQKCYDDNGHVVSIAASLDGFIFNFDTRLLSDAAQRFKGALSQHFTSARLLTAYGEVELYGFIDEWKLGKVYDIKTTGRYTFGDFERSWQKDLYPYCLIASGECDKDAIAEFEYSVYQLSKPSMRTPIISGKFYPEVYTFDFERSQARLVHGCERFIEWLEAHRDEITDAKIFGGKGGHNE